MKKWDEMNEHEKNEHLGKLGGCGNCWMWCSGVNGGEKGCRIRLRPEEYFNLTNGLNYQIYDNGCKHILPIKETLNDPTTAVDATC